MKLAAFQIICIFVLSAIFGFAVNAVREDGIRLIRQPLKETRKYANVKSLEDQGSRLKSNDIKESKQKPKASNPQQQTAKVTKVQSVILNKMKDFPHQEKKMSLVTSNKTKAIKSTQALFISLNDAKSIYDNAVFIDARPIEDFDASHITGAISLDYNEFQIIADNVLANISKDKTIITYCSDSECESSMELGDLIVKKGYKRVFILIDGLPGWKQLGYPIESTDPLGNTP